MGELQGERRKDEDNRNCRNLDSKGEEFLYVKKLVEKLGLQTYMIHTGVFEPAFEPDVSNREVAEAAGYDIDKIVEKRQSISDGSTF